MKTKITAGAKVLIVVIILCVAGIICALYLSRFKGNGNISKGSFSLIPSEYHSYDLPYAEYRSNQIHLTEDQIKELVFFLSDHQAETTDEIAFADTYKNSAYLVLSFFNENNSAFYSLAICVGRNGTEECYAVSNSSNLYYASITDSSVFYSKMMALLASWGFTQ